MSRRNNDNHAPQDLLDISDFLTTEIHNNSDVELLNVSNNEMVFCLQDIDDDQQLYYDYEKEENVTVDEYVKMNFLMHPHPKGSFCEFRDDKTNRMKKVNGQVYKKIENPGFGPLMDLSKYKVVYEYSFFLENSSDPLDSSRFKNSLGVIHINKDIFTFAGIQDAVSTMKYKEKSLFWISHELMYGLLGARPRIPPKADFLARIRVKKIFDNDGNELKLKMSKFEETIQSATKAYSIAKTHYNKQDYNVAITTYRKWINILENTHLANEEQEKEWKEHLSKMYLNICLCYNKIENPQRTCLAMKELEKLTPISENVKALFAKGKAQMMLHHENEAQKCFEAALKIDPNNEKILNTLEELESVKHAKKEYDQQMDYLKVQCDKENRALSGKEQHIQKYLDSLEAASKSQQES